ncbi:MAG: hypothetical protein ACXADW_24785 [Candidatus Hodarchaeales archaeon]|jgi:hypothetical protein
MSELDRKIAEVKELSKEVVCKFGTSYEIVWTNETYEQVYTDENILVVCSPKGITVTMYDRSAGFIESKLALSHYYDQNAIFNYEHCKEAVSYMQELLTGLAIYYDDFFYICDEKS